MRCNKIENFNRMIIQRGYVVPVVLTIAHSPGTLREDR